MKIICLVCNNEFEPNIHTPSTQKYCTIKCQKKANYIRHKATLSLKKKEKYNLNRQVVLDRVKKYAIANKDKIKVYKSMYRKKNRDKLKLVDKEYYQNNKKYLLEKARIYLNKRYKKDMEYVIKSRLKARIRIAIKKYIKERRILESKDNILNYKKIIEHLKPFPKDISRYHIDHIKPLCAFDFSNLEEIKKAFSPENHQWLTIEENLSKGGKYEV